MVVFLMFTKTSVTPHKWVDLCARSSLLMRQLSSDSPVVLVVSLWGSFDARNRSPLAVLLISVIPVGLISRFSFGKIRVVLSTSLNQRT